MTFKHVVAAALLFAGIAGIAGCAAGPQPSALEWLKAEELKDPYRR